VGQIYLVRHGQTAWNKARIFRGRTDVRLNEEGRREAARAARVLRDVPFSCIYTSPLSRAGETARIVSSAHSVPVRPDPAFIDIDYGAWTEYWDTEARRKFRDQYRVWEESPHLVKFPGGESLADVRNRAMPRVRELARRHQRETIALVSHRVVLKVIICAVKGLDNSHFWKVRLDTGSISILESQGDTLRILVENDAGHLASLCGHESSDF